MAGIVIIANAALIAMQQRVVVFMYSFCVFETSPVLSF